MKFAFPLPHLVELKETPAWERQVTGPQMAYLAREAERLGYDMIAVPEHFIIPRAHVPLSGAHYFHAAAAQGFFAGATERIRINSCIAILPLQHPVVTAKALATVDWLSGGRVMATFGVGWLEGEFQLLGVPFSERGRRADEYLAAILELWTSDDPQFEGRYVSFRDVAFAPRPVQKPHPPIWLGGDADPVLRRAAKYASGWWPFLTPPERLAERIDFIKSQPEFRGEPFEVMYGLSTERLGEGHVVRDVARARPGQSKQAIIDRLGWFKEQGVTMTSVPTPPCRDLEECLDYARFVIEEIKPALQ
ncbi:MAG: LLM class F420-dependent oxidoreductase [Porticoccaceae bacterium]|nr:MAG: LLM class F420-dependent oxidoreductase [Porticoccaceae bacterium]